MSERFAVETYFIQNLEDLRLMCKPPRPEIIERCKRAMTVAELAAALGELASRLYYHVNELERIGLLRIVEIRDKGNLREKVYQTIAPSIRVDPSVFQSTDEGREMLNETVLALLATAAESYRRAARRGHIAPEAVPVMTHAFDELRLSPADVGELSARLRTIVEEFRGRSQPELPVTTQLTVIAVPIAGDDR